MKKAAIILPTFNEEGNIEELIEGLWQQINTIDYWDFSILVVDSFSKDQTAHIVKKMQKNITAFIF